MLSRHTGSRFARDLENIASRVYAGRVENVVDSTRFDRIDTIRFPCCGFVTPVVDLRETYPLSVAYPNLTSTLQENIHNESSPIMKYVRQID